MSRLGVSAAAEAQADRHVDEPAMGALHAATECQCITVQSGPVSTSDATVSVQP